MDDVFSIRSLSSGSGGNCWLLKAGDVRLLVDAGISAKQIVTRMTLAGEDPGLVCGVVVTHEHGDHVSGIPTLSRRFGYTTWAVKEAVEQVRGSRNGPLAGERGVKLEYIRSGEEFRIGDLSVRPFSVSHDTVDPVMYVFEYRDKRIGFATDLGVVTRLVQQRLAGVNALVIESNHDVDMLINGPYRPEDKKRIKGRYGHLSNEQAQELVRNTAHGGLEHVVLAHISQTNNTPELAFTGMRRVLDEVHPKCNLLVSHQDKVGSEVLVGSQLPSDLSDLSELSDKSDC